MDGTVVEQLSGIDYIRAANSDREEVRRVERVAERRRASEVRHHFEMSLFGCGKALNEGFFHLMVVAFAVYLFVHGGISNGDILAFSGLFLSVMAPLNEVHRFIDEAHESSLRVGDLLEILAQPSDRSFEPAGSARAVLDHGRASDRGRGPAGRLPYVRRQAEAGPERRLAGDPPRRDDRRGGPLRVRQVDLAPRPDAADAPLRRPGDARRRAAGVGRPRGDRRADRLRRAEPVHLRRHDRREHRLRLRRRHPRQDPPRRRDGVHPRRDRRDARRLPGGRRRARPEPLRRPAAADRPGAGLPEEPADPDPRRGDLGAGQHQRAARSSGRSTLPAPTGR